MLEIRTILAPIDFSEHAARAVRYACGLAGRLGAGLHLLHVLPDAIVPVGPEPLLTPALPPGYYAEAEADSLRALGRVIQADWGAGSAPVATFVRWGDPVGGIVAHAAERAIDLIVIATHGRTGLSHILLGSVAEKIVREAPCPVLTVRDRDDGRPA